MRKRTLLPFLRRFLAGRTRQRNASAAVPKASFPSISRPEDGTSRFSPEFLPLPGQAPFEMLRFYRCLRDGVPDISDAVWTWKRLCNTGHDLAVEAVGKGASRDHALETLAAFEERVHPRGGGLAGLLDLFYASLFTYGAAALEAVPGNARRGLHDIVPVDVWTVRFRREGERLTPWQYFEGEETALPEDLFFYMGLDRDGTNPYGRSMMRSLPEAVRIQQQLLSDMARATHNAGWNKLHVRYHPEEQQDGETEEAYQERISANLRRLGDLLRDTAIDQNLVTFDNVEVGMLSGNQRSQVFYENHKAVEEQVITGMHMMPVLMGRNYGSTETYGTAQFEVVNRQVQTVNRQVSDMLTRIYTLELALAGVDARVRVTMRGNRTVDILKEAAARGREIDNTLRLLDAGLIGREEAERRASPA